MHAFVVVAVVVYVTLPLARPLNDNTGKGEESAWRKYYLPYCREMNTAPWRCFEAHTHPLREGAFLCGFAMRVWSKMKPRRKNDRRPRVDSVRHVIGHVRRRHERRGYVLASTHMLAHVLRGLTRRRIADYGLALPVRAEPFTVQENVALKAVPATTKVAGRLRPPQYWAGWRMVDTYGDQTGSRKSEIVGYDDIAYMWSDIEYEIAGVWYADPDKQLLQSMVSKRDKITAKVNISKADFDGTKFGPSLVALLYNEDNPMSFAAALRDYALAYPVRGAARNTTPLFTTDGTTRWTADGIDTTLKAAMGATLSTAQCKGKTFHSKRVFVASALGSPQLNSSDGEIQAFVRWSTAESLRIYKRIGLTYQAQRRDQMLQAEIDVHNSTRRTEVGDEEARNDHGDLNALADALENEEA